MAVKVIRSNRFLHREARKIQTGLQKIRMRGMVRDNSLRMIKSFDQLPDGAIEDSSLPLSLNSVFSEVLTHDAFSAMEGLRKTVVLVPVFNSLDLVEKCLTSVLESEPNLNLIIVDDSSTDSRIFPYLIHFKSQHESWVHVLQTESNQGFPGAANIGLQFALQNFPGYDVLLLNSDSVLPKFAIQRMQKGFRDPLVATITPLTNAGTISSIPDLNSEIQINQSLCNDLDFIASGSMEFARTTSWPEIPTGVGFCLLISSRALILVGLFDEITFERGYGEENDWCLRATHAGLKHLQCPTVFVSHVHGASYSTTKTWLMQSHQAILNEKYASYGTLIGNYVLNDPLKDYRWVLLLKAISGSKDYKIRVIIDHQQGGGATHTLNQELLEAQNDLSIIIKKFYPNRNLLTIEFRFRNIRREINIKMNELTNFMSELNIDLFVINTLTHTTDQPEKFKSLIADLMLLAEETEVRIHDYSFACPSINLIDNFGVFCDIPKISKCDTCLTRNSFNSQKWDHSISDWRNTWSEMLKNANKIVFFSKESHERFLRAFPFLNSEQVTIRYHLVTDYSMNIKSQRKIINPYGLTVAIPGDLPYHKGAYVMIELAQAMAQDSPKHLIHAIGNTNVEVPNGLPIWGRGAYSSPKELVGLIGQISPDVIFIPTVWPETFNLVSEELKHSEIPIIMFKLGAPWERHSQKPNFIFIEPMTGKTLLQRIKLELTDFYSRI